MLESLLSILKRRTKLATELLKDSGEELIAEKAAVKPWVLIGWPFAIGFVYGLIWNQLPYGTIFDAISSFL